MPYTVDEVRKMMQKNNLRNLDAYNQHLESIRSAAKERNRIKEGASARRQTNQNVNAKVPNVDERKTLRATSQVSSYLDGGLSQKATPYAAKNQTRETEQVEIPYLKPLQINTADTDALLGKALQGDYKMSKAEQKQVRDYSKKWLDSYNKKIRSGEVSQSQEAKDMTDSNSDYAKMTRLYNKSRSSSAFVLGLMESATRLPGLSSIGKKIDDMGNGTYRQYDNITGMIKDAQTQNPIVEGAGNMAGEMAKYQTANAIMAGIPAVAKAKQAVSGAVSSIPFLGGGEVAAKIGESTANVLSDLTLDTAFDTIPYLQETKQEGETAGQAASKALKRTGYNLGMNIAGEAIPYLVSRVGKSAKNLFGSSADNMADVGREIADATNSARTIENGAETATNALEQANMPTKKLPELQYDFSQPQSAKQVENILIDSKARREFQQQSGVELTGTKSEQRRQVQEWLGMSDEERIANRISNEARSGKKITDPVEKAFFDGNVSATHTPEEISKMKEYLQSTDSNILDYMDEVRSGNSKAKYHDLKPVSDRAADDIKRITGIDAGGNRVILDKDTITHIDKRHGVNGSADKSMADDLTLSRIQYILDNYDEAAPGKSTTKIRTKDGKKAPTVLFQKKVDGMYYVVEAATDAKTKKNVIVSAYTTTKPAVEDIKIAAHPATNADLKSPLPTSKIEAEAAADSSLQTVGENVKPIDSTNEPDMYEELPFTTSDTYWQVTETASNLKADTKSLEKKLDEVILDNADDLKASTLAQQVKMNLQMYSSGTASEESLKKSIKNLNDYLTSKGSNYDFDEELYRLMGNIQKSTGNAVDMSVDLNTPTKNSKSATNTFRNSDIFKSIDGASDTIESGIKDGNFKYNPKSEKESIRAAAEALEKDSAKEEYRLRNTVWTNGSRDTDEAMMILEQKFNDAMDTGDYSDALEFSQIVSAQVRNQAQGVQAMAKYSRTSTGTLEKAQTLIDKSVDEWKKINPGSAEEVRNLAEDIVNEIGKMQDFNSSDYEASMKEIINALKEKLSQSEIGKNIDDSGINKIADMLKKGTDVDKIEKTVDSIMALGWPGIDDDTAQQVIDIFRGAAKYGPDSKQRVEAELKAYALLADKIITPNWQDKWDTWRYMSMLANPTTHIRNIGGNAVMYAVSEIKDDLGYVIESAVDAASKSRGGTGITRTKSILNPLNASDKALKKAAADDAVDVVYRQLSGSKFGVSSGIEMQSKAFRGKATQYIQKIADINGDLLEKEDWLGLKSKYTKTLAEYLKANGADSSIFNSTDSTSKALLNRARAYAISQAQEATFHEDSKFAEALTQFSKTLNTGGTVEKASSALIEGVMPFKKTPYNILREGGRYSPLGIIRGIWKTGSALKKGRYTATQAIESMSKGLTGTGILALGAFLASKGILRAKGSNDSDQNDFDKLQGAQDYSIVFGDKSYTIDWMAPSTLPLIVGASLQENMSDGMDAGDFISALASIADPIIDASFMSGIQSALESVQYADQGKEVQTIVGNTLAGYAAQGVPTVAGKVTRAFDNTRRSNLTERTGALGQLEYQYRRARGKLPSLPGDIPVLSDQNPEYVDAWGRTQQNNPLSNDLIPDLVYQMASPGYVSKKNTTEVDAALQKLYDSTKDSGVLPSKISRTYNGGRLTIEQYTKAQTIAGQEGYKMIDDIIKTDAYDDLPDADKAATVNDMYGLAKAIALKETVGKEMSSQNKKLYDIYKKDGAEMVVQYYRYKNIEKTDDASRTKNLQEAMNQSDMSRQEKQQLYGLFSPTTKSENNPYTAENVQIAAQRSKIQPNYDSGLLQSATYNSMDTTERKKFDDKMDKFLNAYSESQITGEEISSGYKKYAQIFEDLGSDGLAQYYVYRKNADVDGNGSLTKDEVVSYLNENPMLTAYDRRLWFSYLSRAKNPY